MEEEINAYLMPVGRQSGNQKAFIMETQNR